MAYGRVGKLGSWYLLLLLSLVLVLKILGQRNSQGNWSLKPGKTILFIFM